MELDGKYWSMVICKASKGERSGGNCDAAVDEARQVSSLKGGSLLGWSD